MRKAEVGKCSGVHKCMLVNETYVVKSSQSAVRIIRGTKVSVGCARIAAGNAVTAASPGPTHCVANIDVDCAWIKGKRRADLHIHDLSRA